MQPHQQRVVDEKSELDKKLEALKKFFTSEIFLKLNPDEQERLERQASHMSAYSQVLGERVAAF